MAGVSLAFYAVFRTGANLRFRDPSLTAEIIFSAILCVALIGYWSDKARPAVEMFYLMALMLGALRLGAPRLLGLAAIALCAHAGMLYLWHAKHPGIDIADALMDLSALAIILPWFAAMGAYVYGLRARLSEANHKLADALGRIEEIAVHDELTGLYNRRFLLEVLARETAVQHRTGRVFAVCMLDIDHFKSVNDTFGHGAGDAVLKHFAAVSAAGKRGADVFGRLGGEEFLMRKAIEASTFPELPAGRRITVTAGVAQSHAGEPPDGLVARADGALYTGKAAGRNRVEAAPECTSTDTPTDRTINTVAEVLK